MSGNDGKNDPRSQQLARRENGVDDSLSSEVTSLLSAWSAGDVSALEELFPIVTQELRRQARRLLSRESQGHTLQPTALVNELYLRVVGRRSVQFQNRSHFFGFAAQAMRRILVDYARGKKRKKRNAGEPTFSLDEIDGVTLPTDLDVLDLDVALDKLESLDPRQARIIELRYFVGLTLEEVADSLDVSRALVCKEWALARSWLRRELSEA